MSESENVLGLRKAYQIWNDSKGADTSGFLSIFSDDIRLTSIAGASQAQFTRSRYGRADVEDYFQGINDDWDMHYYRMTEYLEQGDRVVAIRTCFWTNKRTGKIADTVKIDVWRFKDRQAVEISEFYDTACVFAAAS